MTYKIVFRANNLPGVHTHIYVANNENHALKKFRKDYPLAQVMQVMKLEVHT